ncbi:MAG: GtrA family protein [Bacteroidales bacterium]
MITQFIKFAFVGATGTLLDFGITWLCKEKLNYNKYVANSIGFLVAATSNFILNRVWTFESKNPDIQYEYLLFMLISILGLSINNMVIFGLSKPWADKFFKIIPQYRFYVSKIVATGVVILWNFFMNYFYTFAQSM